MEQKLRLIRGPRIIQQLNTLEEATYSDLERNTMQFQPATTKRQHATNAVQIGQLSLVAYPQSNMLGVNAVAHSGGNSYQPQMMFEDVEYVDVESEEEIQSPNTTTFMSSNGEEYTIMPISLQQNNVKVRCTCLDFRWRFAMYNGKAGSLYGEGPDLYQKKTQRPPNNPKGVPGLCKHLLRLAIELKNNRVVQV